MTNQDGRLQEQPTPEVTVTPRPAHELWYVSTYNHQDPGQSLNNALAIWPASVAPGTLGRPIALVSPLSSVDEFDLANARLLAAAPALLGALIHARSVIQQWHDMQDENPEAWAIYRDKAPEMRRINEAIALAMPNDTTPKAQPDDTSTH